MRFDLPYWKIYSDDLDLSVRSTILSLLVKIKLWAQVII